jgi:hypothetical protein
MRLRRFSEHIRAHDWFAVAVDFVIVVLGVYVAVWAAGLQAAHERQQRTAKAVAALRHDLQDAIDAEQMFDDTLDAAFAAFTAARQRGETPPPVYLRISGSDTPPKSPCQGVLQTQLAELIDPALLWDLCFYYDERDGTGQKYVRYAVFTENEILPRMKDDPRAFYTDEGTRLAPAFESHMDRLREWRRDLVTQSEWARCLYTRLSEPSKVGGSCRPIVGGTLDVGGPNLR